MRLITWNLARRKSKLKEQLAAMLQRKPDIVALQEVTASTEEGLRRGLAEGGLAHAASSTVSAVQSARSKSRSLSVLVASRFPLQADRKFSDSLPWSEKGVGVSIEHPAGPVSLFSVHIPPGSGNGWLKIDTLEAVYEFLQPKLAERTVLCGDFNCPQTETTNGEVVTWGQKLSRAGSYYVVKSRKGGDGESWDRGERNVIEGLPKLGLRDVFRSVHGYDVANAFSWEHTRQGTITRRRFDHIFATDDLGFVEANYLHHFREDGLSDHSPLEAIS